MANFVTLVINLVGWAITIWMVANGMWMALAVMIIINLLIGIHDGQARAERNRRTGR